MAEVNGDNENAQQVNKSDDDGARRAIKKLKNKFLPGFKYTLLFSICIYVAMFVVGCLGVHKCPLNEKIPLFLIITGTVGLFSKLVSYLRDRILKHFQVKYFESALYSIELVTFILGSYWVYKEYKPNFNPIDDNYCQKTAYMFAFVYLTVMYTVFLLVLLVFLCVLICCCCAMKKLIQFIENCDPESLEPINKESEPNITEPSNNEKSAV